MVHLRIVVPAYQAEHAVDLLDDSPSACNLIWLPGAARRPEGDVILCDVARDDASMLVADLRELDIDIEGSISIEEIDSEISAAADRAEAAAHRLHSDPVVWEEVEAHTSESVELNSTFLLFITMAALIAAAGIYLDAPILIVGAMVVGPEFGPIAGACVAIVNREQGLVRRSAAALAVGFPVAIGAALLSTLAFRALSLIPESLDFEANAFTHFIADPSFFSIWVALLAGIVGMLSLTSAKSSVLVGVLISVATIPAAANMGVAAAYGDWSTVGGATAQLVLNLTAIFAGGLATLFLQRRLYMGRRIAHLSDRARVRAGLPIGSSRHQRPIDGRPPSQTRPPGE